MVSCQPINEWLILRQTRKEFNKEFKAQCADFATFKKLDPCTKIRYMDTLIAHEPINDHCFAKMIIIMSAIADTSVSPRVITSLDLLLNDSVYYSERDAWRKKLKCN